jgi:hypothetical protein
LMWGQMPLYRFYRLKKGGHTAGPPEILDCRDDASAIAKAKELLNVLEIEVWDGARRVINLQPGSAAG